MTTDSLNLQTINMQIGYTRSQIDDLKNRIKNRNFKSTPISGLHECMKRAQKSVADLEQNLCELNALKRDYNITGKGKKIS